MEDPYPMVHPYRQLVTIELQRKIPDVTRRVLNVQLKELEDHELVTKKIYPVLPPKVEYSLTDFGKTLIPLISAIGLWGDENQNRLRRVILKHTQASSHEPVKLLL